MKKARIFLFALTVFCLSALAATAQTPSNIVKGNLSQAEIDRIVAVFPDGRGYAWHQINACGEVVFDGDPAPEGCPPVPERLE